MMLKEKKLSVVMAFILGTTMFSSVDKAWGMDDENDLKGIVRASSSASSSFDEKSLPGDLLLRGTHVRLEKHFVEVIYNLMDSAKNTADMKRVINKERLEQLLHGNFARVAANVRRASLANKPKPETVLKDSLKAIMDESHDDPYDQLILAHLSSGYKLDLLTREEIADLEREFISLPKDKLTEFLESGLKYVVEKTPGIVPSLLAHFPKTSQEKEDEKRAVQSLISFFIPGNEQRSLILEIDKIHKKEDEQLPANFAERYALLRQIEQMEESLRATPLLPQLPTPDPLPSSSSMPLPDPLLLSPSSSSSMGSPKASRIIDAVSFNSTFEIEMGNLIPRGWSLHDGRNGRVGEERTAENPLQVEVIENGKIKITGDMHNFYYPLPELKDFAGQEVRFSAKVKSTVPGTRLAYMGKRGNQINSDPHSNREGEETISLTFVVDSDPTSLNNLYFLGGRAKVGTPPSMEISDINLELMSGND